MFAGANAGILGVQSPLLPSKQHQAGIAACCHKQEHDDEAILKQHRVRLVLRVCWPPLVAHVVAQAFKSPKPSSLDLGVTLPASLVIHGSEVSLLYCDASAERLPGADSFDHPLSTDFCSDRFPNTTLEASSDA
eukprot:1301555-Amphidinium_carterae.1